LKSADSARLAQLAVPHLRKAGWVTEPTPQGLEYLARVVPAAAASVDRLEQVPARLHFLFDYSAERALENPAIRREALDPGAHAVIVALAEELAGSDRLSDKHAFRAAAARVREKTGQKGKALFHPIRLALTGESEGLELDLAVPAIEAGAELGEGAGIRAVAGAKVRAAAFAAAIAQR
jgi:hypothetical protein